MKSVVLSLGLVLICAGCESLVQPINLLPLDEEKDEPRVDLETKTKVDTELIGKFVNIGNLNVVRLEGVGLVTGLPNTGGDPPVSPERTMLLDDMRRRGIPNPNEILESRSTALVVVQAALPPNVDKGERFDVTVKVPGNTDVKSLNGGYLLETILTEKYNVRGVGVKEGRDYAKAFGPIMTGAVSAADADDQRGVLIHGRILGGGYSLKHRDMTLLLRNEFRSSRMSYRIATRIGERFFDYETGGQRVPLAEAKTDELIVLKIHRRYKDNFPRYLEVIRNIALKESEVAERLRIEQLHEQLHNPGESELAAVRLEAIGRPAIDTLKTGLKNPSLEVRFHSAEALAYLGESDGVKELALAARDEPAFRVYALAALAIVDDASAFIELRSLLEAPSAETRYGAFRALRSLDENDPLVRGEMTKAGFRLHVLDVPGDPMVHLTRFKMAEIVLFGAQQKFTFPLVARAGKDIMVTGHSGEGDITISRITLNEKEREQVPNDIASVLRAISDMGASYPDVAQFLIQAEQQGNLQGRLEMDALPKVGRIYERKGDEFSNTYDKRTRIGRPTMAPNIFNDADHTVDPERQRKIAEKTARQKREAEAAAASEPPKPAPKPPGKFDSVLKQIYGF